MKLFNESYYCREDERIMSHIIDDCETDILLQQGHTEPIIDQDGEILCNCCITIFRVLKIFCEKIS